MSPGQALAALMAAWERGDPGAVAELFSDVGAYEDPLLEARLVGPQAIRAGVAEAMAAITDCHADIKNVVESGPLGICEGYFASRLADAEGRLDFAFAAVVEMREGKIARLTEYFDTRPLGV
jgi:ketosteroid isomerase-like protein